MEAYAVGPGICSSCVVAKWPSYRAAFRQSLSIGCDLTGNLRCFTSSSSSKTELGARCGGISFGKSSPARKRAPVRWRCQDAKNVLTTADESESESASSSDEVAKQLPGFVEFITSGVLAGKVGATPERLLGQLGEWMLLGNKLSDFLDFSSGGLSPAEIIRLYQYYLPVFFWCLNQLAIHRSRFAEGEPIPPIVIGINAPQGCGKTTVVEAIEFLFGSIGRTAVAVSVDDFYLTGADQDKLAADNPDNGLLEFRGNAGSHDLEFGTQTLKALLGLTSKGLTAKIPRYDKAARSGRGDRGDPSRWTQVEGPVQVILFEGWMLGYEPQDTEAVTAIDPQLALVNKHLEGYFDAWYSFVNSWIIIQVADPSWVFNWRLEAEIKMRKKGRGGMTDDEIADFVSRYMPAYKAYLPSLYSAGPTNSTADNTLKFNINKDRNPVP